VGVGTFGEKLRREREMRAITLDEIAEATKIGTRSLKALEDERFDILPGGIFNKGFVRSYAKYLGLDQEQAVVDYLAAAGEQPDAKPETLVVKELASQAEVARQRKEALEAASGKLPSGSWTSFLVLLVLIAVGTGGWKFYELRKSAKEAATQAAIAAQLQSAKEQQEAARQAQLQAAVSADPDSSTATTSDASAPTSASGIDGQQASAQIPPSQATLQNKTVVTLSSIEAKAGAATQEFHVQVRAKDRMWVQVTADGAVVKEGMLSVNEEQTYNARTKLVVISGKPGSVEVLWNGKQIAVPQVTTKSQTLVFTAEGIQETAHP